MIPQIGTGDTGTTSLFGGTRVPKDDIRIEAVGTIDELQSLMGMILSRDLEPESRQVLENLPHLLFDISGEIASEGKFTAQNVTSGETEKMTEWVQFFDKKMPELREFMLPSGASSSQWLNLARAVTRRAERRVFPLLEGKDIRAEVFTFLNRLSRLLFSVERWENMQKKGEERKWEKGMSISPVPTTE